jgi:predicted small lipoprotein YifL
MRRVVGAAVVLGMLALSGCGGSDPLPTLPPTPSTAPVFASEEEALAAAEAAYAAYLEMSNLISSEGGVDPERIAPFVTPEQLPDELDGLAFFVENGIRSVGAAQVTEVFLQQYNESGGAAEVTFYVCLDVTDVVILNAKGADVTPADRAPIVALEVSYVGTAEAFLLADSDQWSDSQFCSSS